MTTSPAPWEHPANELTSFARAIGLGVSFKERPDMLSYYEEDFATQNFSTDPHQIQTLDAAFAGIMKKYGTSLTFLFTVGKIELSQQNYTRDELKHFCEQLDGSPVRLSFEIDKGKLLDYWGLTHASANIKVFFFPDALEQALNRPLTELEAGNALLENFDGSKKVIIFVPDHDIDLNGTYLAIIGGAAMANWEEYLPAASPDEARAKIESVCAGATNPPRWGPDIELKHLSPLQLSVYWKNPRNQIVRIPDKTDLIAKRLYAHLLACSLLYMGTYSKKPKSKTEANSNTGAFETTFAEDKYLAHVSVGTTDEIAETLIKGNEENPWEASILMGKLVDWAYQEEPTLAVRLRILQAVVASSLQDNQTADRLLGLVRCAREIHERVLSRWQAFWDDKLDKYFSDLRALEEAVEATCRSYNEQVQSLTKTLTDNILGAVGVVVGSFLVAIFATPFRRHVFLFGTITYLAYLIFFPVLIGLISAWQRYKDSQDSFNKRQQEFGNRMKDPAGVQKIVGQSVAKRERWFRRWFYTSATIYVFVIGLMLTTIITVPRMIKRWTDDFSLTDVSYVKPLDGRTVPITIRGNNFDKDKEIAVNVGDARFTNTGESAFKVHGSTVLTLSPARKDLQTAKEKHKGLVTVRQGSAGERTVQLPVDSLPASPDPEFKKWSWLPQKKGVSLEASGSNFDSIAEIVVAGVKPEFWVSEDGKTITIRDLVKPTKSEVITLLLTDGRRMTVAVRWDG